jgi:hypothetical protein
MMMSKYRSKVSSEGGEKPKTANPDEVLRRMLNTPPKKRKKQQEKKPAK